MPADRERTRADDPDIPVHESSGVDGLEALRSEIAELARAVSEQADRTAQVIQSKVHSTSGWLSDSIARQPTRGVVAALGLGFLLGMIATRSDRT